ncbi:MAG: tRNA pseudouridine(13) synthase TruD [Campylobacteraceae bacterium]|nr:tRNA pseudouridine(13) synthase TruD [Campylobacteraceae bacterium]
MNKLYFMNHSPIQAYFTKNSNDFVVSEIPLYEFSNEGEHLVLHVRKKDLTTWQMLQVFSQISGAKMRDFGYAGLKDKDGMTTQYISIHKSYEKAFENFTHQNIKILSSNYHNNKIKIGHLKGNRFFIRLKKVLPIDALKIKEAFGRISKEGYPNYFGYQRFGKSGDNFNEGRAILLGERRERNRKLEDFLISAYQSELFNHWLSKRVEISKYFESFNEKELQSTLGWDKNDIKEVKKQSQFFKLLKGDVCHHYPHGKAFICEDVGAELERFNAKDITITGWLVGGRTMRACDLAGEIENDCFDEAEVFSNKLDGTRRFAWNFIENPEFKYKEEDAWVELAFTLTKGAYATVVLEEILHKELAE